MEQFEKNIKEKLSEREIEASAYAWNKLERMLQDKKMKKTKTKSKTIWFIAASVLIFVCFGTFFFKMNLENKQPIGIHDNSNQILVVNEAVNEQEKNSSEEKTKQAETTSETKIFKAKAKNIEIVNISKEETKRMEFKESEVKVNKELIIEKIAVEESKQITELKTDNYNPKTDPNRLLMVAEYERNVEKSASQFKQMKEKFQEVKTVLNNINQ